MSKTVKIQIIADYQDYKKGQIVELDEKDANTLLTNKQSTSNSQKNNCE